MINVKKIKIYNIFGTILIIPVLFMSIIFSFIASSSFPFLILTFIVLLLGYKYKLVASLATLLISIFFILMLIEGSEGLDEEIIFVFFILLPFISAIFFFLSYRLKKTSSV